MRDSLASLLSSIRGSEITIWPESGLQVMGGFLITKLQILLRASLSPCGMLGDLQTSQALVHFSQKAERFILSQNLNDCIGEPQVRASAVVILRLYFYVLELTLDTSPPNWNPDSRWARTLPHTGRYIRSKVDTLFPVDVQVLQRG